MKIVVKEREFIMDKFKLEGNFKECVNKIKDIYKDVACQLDFTRDSIIVNIIR